MVQNAKVPEHKKAAHFIKKSTLQKGAYKNNSVSTTETHSLVKHPVLGKGMFPDTFSLQKQNESQYNK